MPKQEVSLMLLVIVLSILGSWVSLGGGQNDAPGIVVVEADENHAVIRLDISGYTVQQISEYSRLSVADCNWDMNAPTGTPELPAIPVVIGIPAGMEPFVSAVSGNWISAGSGTPYPVQPLRVDCESEPFYFVDLFSDLSGVFPQNTVNLLQQGNWAGVNTVVLQFNPFTWNSETGEFQVASTITATVDFRGARAYQTSVRPEVANMHRSRIVNYESLGIPVDASPVTINDNVYICVVPSENLDSVTPLLTMVNSLGHHVKIIVMETGSSSYQIKAAITAAYQEGTTRFALIPARYQQLESKNYGEFVGDFYYELITSDNLPDIAVGRYPGDFSQLENQTAKTMSYITYQGETGQPSLPVSVILAAHQEEYPGKYTANSNAVRDYDYALADLVFETCYPPEGGTAEQVEAAINNGVGIVNYRGHGSNTIWQWSPGWSAGNIYGLENTFFPPVFNICCSNGRHDLSYNCLSESWMDGPGVGASGNIGASAPSFTIVNDRMQKVLFWQIFDEGNTCAGEVFSASQTDIVQTQGAGGLTNSRMYHWFGDPSMDIPNSDLPGTPFPIDVDVPAMLNPGQNTLHLTVTSGGAPVEGAVVTVTDGIGNHSAFPESFYQQQITGNSGEVWLDFTVLEGKDLFYGVRMHNYASVTGTINVTAQGIQGGNAPSAELFPVSPGPVNGMAEISYSVPTNCHLSIQIADIAGRILSTLVDGDVTAGNGALTLNSLEMAPGIYFVILQAGDTSITRRIAVVR